jgi:hypothetical protein
MNTRYPIYIISKGRWQSRLTVKALEEMGQDYRIVVEPQERDRYAEVIADDKILTLPFGNLGQGGIPARNWVLEHSRANGDKRHWILDDNIERFNRLHNNLQVKVVCNAMFRAAEDFVDRYENVALAGFEYDFFVKSRAKWKPYRLNTRIYSCILIDNSIPFNWRGKYNEDTDLSLRCLKAGLCTVLFLTFVQQKTQTMKMKGGNTEELYAATDNRREFAESLRDQHPDVVTVGRRFGRWHHIVDYRPFKSNALIRRPDVVIPQGVNNYGMKLLDLTNP